MHHDRLRGSGFWSGCFKFDNITFDGDEIPCAKPRTGGLKQGGKYWYYYRLNYDSETFDDRQPQTTSCPLLPGQPVNIIEVPTEIIELPERCRSAHGYGDIIGSLARLADQQTLDPKHKFAMLEPPPLSKVHARCYSDDALAGRLENQPPIVSEKRTSSSSTPVSAGPESSHSWDSDHHHRRQLSGASSVYSQDSSHSAAISTLSRISEMSALVAKGRNPRVLGEERTIKLTTFPNRRPPPLNFDALNSTWFDSSETVSPTCFTRAGTDDRDERETGPYLYSCSAESIRNVQFYGSRPGTSLDADEEQHRPRVYSLPNRDVSDVSDYSRPGSPTSVYSPRDSDFCDEAPTPEDGNFNLISPTFSASTISTGGHNTPFRLSAQATAEGGDVVEEDQDVSAETSRNTSNPSLFERGMARLGPPSFLNYSLPNSVTESNNSLAKTASTPSARATPHGHNLPLPGIFQESTGRSMADDIFSELGYLSGNIH